MASTRHERAERGTRSGQAVDRERADRRPMVGNAARDRLPAMREAAGRLVLLGQLERRLNRLGAARGEEDTGVATQRSQVAEPVSQHSGRDTGVAEWVDERHRFELGHHRLGDPALPIAGVDRVNASQEVEVRLAVLVPDGRAFALDQDERTRLGVLVVGHLGEVEPEIVANGLPNPLAVVSGSQLVATCRAGNSRCCRHLDVSCLLRSSSCRVAPDTDPRDSHSEARDWETFAVNSRWLSRSIRSCGLRDKVA